MKIIFVKYTLTLRNGKNWLFRSVKDGRFLNETAFRSTQVDGSLWQCSILNNSKLWNGTELTSMPNLMSILGWKMLEMTIQKFIKNSTTIVGTSCLAYINFHITCNFRCHKPGDITCLNDQTMNQNNWRNFCTRWTELCQKILKNFSQNSISIWVFKVSRGPK